MCINQQQQQAIFAEIERIVEQFEQSYVAQKHVLASDFAEFDGILREANRANNAPYDHEAEKLNQCIFFFPFLDRGSPWQGSVEILKTSKYYIVFDRHGRFSAYHQSENKFGSRVATNSRDDAIAGLEGISATDLIFDARRMKRTITRLKEELAVAALNMRILYEKIDILKEENASRSRHRFLI